MTKAQRSSAPMSREPGNHVDQCDTYRIDAGGVDDLAAGLAESDSLESLFLDPAAIATMKCEPPPSGV